MLYYLTSENTVGHCAEPKVSCSHLHHYYLASAARAMVAAMGELEYHVDEHGEISQCRVGSSCNRAHFSSRRAVVQHHRDTYDFSGRWRPLENPYVSLLELELSSMVKRLGYRVVENTRTVIAPYELDIYLPDEEIALEFNGTHWHGAEQIELRYGITPREYHERKRLRCLEIGVKLGFVWEDSWRQDWLTCLDVICDLIQFRREHDLLTALDVAPPPSKFFWEKMDREAMEERRARIEKRRRRRDGVS